MKKMPYYCYLTDSLLRMQKYCGFDLVYIKANRNVENEAQSSKIKACNRLQYFWFLMKFIKNFEWISFTVMEFPQTNRTFCKVILSKPNKPFHFIFRNIASKIISGQYINVNGEKMQLVVLLWPISQPQFDFDWCKGSLNIQQSRIWTFESQKTEFHGPLDGFIK